MVLSRLWDDPKSAPLRGSLAGVFMLVSILVIAYYLPTAVDCIEYGDATVFGIPERAAPGAFCAAMHVARNIGFVGGILLIVPLTMIPILIVIGVLCGGKARRLAEQGRNSTVNRAVLISLGMLVIAGIVYILR